LRVNVFSLHLITPRIYCSAMQKRLVVKTHLQVTYKPVHVKGTFRSVEMEMEVTLY